MKCENHPSVNAVALCDTCRTPLCGICSRYSGDAVYCEKCEQIASLSSLVREKSAPKGSSRMGDFLREEESRAEAAPKIEPRPRQDKSERSEKLQIAIVILCSLFIVFQITRSLGSGAMLTPQQVAVQEQTRDQIESCMLVFWEIAMRFTNNQQLPATMRCPDSSAPLIVSRTGNDIVVRHPHPEALGLTDIYVSRSSPTPILVE